MTSVAGLRWGHVSKNAQILFYVSAGKTLGELRLGVRNADDEDNPYVNLDYATVVDSERGGETSVRLIKEVARRWPQARLVAGPLTHDDPPGPRFRLRCWDEASVPIHDLFCIQHGSCVCRHDILMEVARRLDAWHDTHGITSIQLGEKKAALGIQLESNGPHG